MINPSAFDELEKPLPGNAGVRIGFPGMSSMFFNSEDQEMSIGGNTIGVEKHKLNGTLTLDRVDSSRQGLFGVLQVFDNQLGTIPSTIFTPTAAKLISIDPELIELALIVAFVTAGSFLDDTVSDGEVNIGPLEVTGL